ncbi:MAG: 16S rRNA (cytosine(1402)-N(4))-methyltransferase RsmH [bacterium]|nr:16S rRNA (cytosine(1402)-N(4))-methyltransferase RsmH [bacterium]MDD5755930.1 16S rRNA (cytosine(1402)-N(4))-methyltransferase RsmH [bacterium]
MLKRQYHQPVMLKEAIMLLDIKKGGIYVDATLGGGGHAQKVLEEIGSHGTLIGMDQDQAAIEHCRELFRNQKNIILEQANFRDLSRILDQRKIKEIDGILFDLGVSSYQLETAERGFSFSQDGPLDMRMDRSQGLTAADLVNSIGLKDLAQVIEDYGEERWAKKIARNIVSAREHCRIDSTSALADIVAGSIPRSKWPDNIHPATRTFQALRITVNNELSVLKPALSTAIRFLKNRGRIVVISFHSLEDRIVKNTLVDFSRGCICPPKLPICVCGHTAEIRILTKKPLQAQDEEIVSNPRSRSAKMRAGERIANG